MSQTLPSFGGVLFNPSSENGKGTTQLTNPNMAVHLNWQAEAVKERFNLTSSEEVHLWSSKDLLLRWDNQFLYRSDKKKTTEYKFCLQFDTSHVGTLQTLLRSVQTCALWSEGKTRSGRKLTPYITLNAPSLVWSMRVAASCCGKAFLQQEQGSCSELMRKWMEFNTRPYWKKTCEV